MEVPVHFEGFDATNLSLWRGFVVLILLVLLVLLVLLLVVDVED